jgi:hypothetical protein
MNRQQTAWWLWAGGSVLIALSWFNVVSNTVGWCGFGLGMMGSILGWGFTPPRGNISSSEDGSPSSAKKKDEA